MLRNGEADQRVDDWQTKRDNRCGGDHSEPHVGVGAVRDQRRAVEAIAGVRDPR